MGIRACVCHHDQIDRLTEQENMSGSRPVPRDGTTTLIQANKHALILSPSLHRTTTKLKSVRSQDKTARRAISVHKTRVCACVCHHLHLSLQVVAQSRWYNYSDPGKQTCPHSLLATTTKLTSVRSHEKKTCRAISVHKM